MPDLANKQIEYYRETDKCKYTFQVWHKRGNYYKFVDGEFLRQRRFLDIDFLRGKHKELLADGFTFKEVDWEEIGDLRVKCYMCNKVVYHTEDKAKHAAESITANREPMKHYQCKSGVWHVSRIKGGKKK